MWQVKNKFMWFIRFAVFFVHEYYFLAYILTVIVQLRVFLFTCKYSLVFMINSIFCLKLSSTYFGHLTLKQKFLVYFITIIFSSKDLVLPYTVQRFCIADTKDIAFSWFHFFICKNYFQLLFNNNNKIIIILLIILEV